MSQPIVIISNSTVRAFSGETSRLNEMLSQSFDVRESDASISTAVSDSPTVLVIGHSSAPISHSDQQATVRHLKRGGGLIICAGEGRCEGTNAILDALKTGIRIEGDCAITGHYTGQMHPKIPVLQHGAVHRQIRTQLAPLAMRRAQAPPPPMGVGALSTESSPAVVFPYGSTLTVKPPAVPLFTTGPLVLPSHQPTVAAVRIHSGRVVVIGSSRMFEDQFFDQECNSGLADTLFRWAGGLTPRVPVDVPATAQQAEAPPAHDSDSDIPMIPAQPDWLLFEPVVASDEVAANGLTAARSQSGVGERRAVTDWGWLAEKPRGILLGSAQMPGRPQGFLDSGGLSQKNYFGRATRVKMACDLAADVGVPDGPVDFVTPELMRPLPPKKAAIHPPRPLVPAGAPQLELFALEAELASAPERLNRLAAAGIDKQTDMEIRRFILGAGSILGITPQEEARRLGRTVEDGTDEAVKLVLYRAASDLVKWKMPQIDDTVDLAASFSRMRGIGGVPDE